MLYLLSLARRCWWGSLLWLLWLLPAQALEMRVAVRQDANYIDIGSSTVGTVRDARGQALFQLPELQPITVDDSGSQLILTDGRNTYGSSSAFWLEASDGGVVWIGDRWYRGRVLLVPSGGAVTAINYVNIEDYLYSVVGSEMPASWPPEALRSQAIAARSYALYHQQRRKGRLYDIGGTQAWQVYKGLPSETNSTRSAVEATRGKVLTYGGRVIEAVFHSSSGGHTENSEHVWTTAVPYLKGVPDFDQSAPVYSWSTQFSLDDVGARLGYPGTVSAIEIASRTPRGRAKDMHIIGNAGTLTITGDTFRQRLGLRSTKFSLGVDAYSVTVAGKGFGHGIGLSQWGAKGMAERGKSYDHILTHFYQGIQVNKKL